MSEWTGGVLNSASAIANVVFTATPVLIAPGGAANTLYTASWLTFQNSAAASFTVGNVMLTQDTGVNVYAAGGATIAAAINSAVAAAGGLAKPFTISGANSKSEFRNGSSELPILVQSDGTMRVRSGNPNDPLAAGTTKITGKHTVQGAGSGSVYVGNGGRLVIDNKNTLKVDHGVRIGTNGRFSTAPILNGQSGQPEPEAKIDGTMTVVGGYVTLGDRAYELVPPVVGTHRFSTLHVTGKVVWSGGTYFASLGDDGTGNLSADLWQSDDTFTITGGAGGALLWPLFIGLPDPNDNYVGWSRAIIFGNKVLFTVAGDKLNFGDPYFAGFMSTGITGGGDSLSVTFTGPIPPLLPPKRPGA